MSLYGDSNTVKGYAFVSLKDKTVVGSGLLDTAKSDAKALNDALDSYIDALKEKGIADDVDKSNIIVDESKINSENGVTDETADSNTEQTTTADTSSSAKTVTGTVDDIKTSVNEGNSVYYLEVNGKYYYINVGDCMEVLLINKGDTVEITTDGGSGKFVAAKNVTVK